MDKIETDGKMDSMEGIGNENTESEDGSMNEEQESVIKKLEEALGFLKNAKIKNKESFANVKKPLEDFLSSLKYLPYEPSFEILPPEIKTGILGYLCDKEAYVAASVCKDWKSILFETKLKNFEVVIIGEHCRKCKDNKCFMPEEILNASITLKLDIPLYICHPIAVFAEVDTQVINEALTSVSKLIVDFECICVVLGTWPQFQLKTATVKLKQIIENILTRPRDTMYLRSLEIGQVIDWRELISPEILLNKLSEVKLRGQFSPEQVKKARSVPGVEASETLISKQ